MVIESILNAIFSLITGLFDLLPELPNVGQDILFSVDAFFDTIFDLLMLLDIFIRPSTIKLIVPLLIIVINFEHIWEFIMFLIRKLPFNIE